VTPRRCGPRSGSPTRGGHGARCKKIDACTEVYDDGRENDRFRDLIDLQLLRDLVDEGELTAVREACVEIFELRGKHTWPPRVTVYPSWATGFAAMATDLGFYTDDVEVAADALREFIAEIDAATRAGASWRWRSTPASGRTG
jgi:hypothetical protein